MLSKNIGLKTKCRFKQQKVFNLDLRIVKEGLVIAKIPR